MPLVDKPLHELRSYVGISPRPDDFDAYWDRALKELDATPPNPEFIPVSPLGNSNSELFDLYFTGVGGARIYAKYLRPKNRTGRIPAVLEFHGYSGQGGDWAGKLAYVNEGFAYAALDCRGQGGSSEDNQPVKGNTLRGHIIRGLADSPEKLLFRQIFLDTAQLARIILSLPEIDPERVGALGGSQGGGLTLACASLEPRIRLAAPVFPFLSDYKRVWQMDLAKDAYDEIRTYFRLFDPLHEKEEKTFHDLGYIDVQHLAPRIRAEVLMTITLMDNICPPSTQFAAYNRITSKKNALIYPDYGHEGIPGNGDKIFQFMMGLKN